MVRLFSGTDSQTSPIPSAFRSWRVKFSFTNTAVVMKEISSSAPVKKNTFCKPSLSPIYPPIIGPRRDPAMFPVERVPRAQPACSLSVWVAIKVVQAVP